MKQAEVSVLTGETSESMLTWDPAGHHPEVPLRAVGVLRPCQQMENTLVLQHQPHKEPGDGHVHRPKIDGQVLVRKSKIAPCARIWCRWWHGEGEASHHPLCLEMRQAQRK